MKPVRFWHVSGPTVVQSSRERVGSNSTDALRLAFPVRRGRISAARPTGDDFVFSGRRKGARPHQDSCKRDRSAPGFDGGQAPETTDKTTAPAKTFNATHYIESWSSRRMIHPGGSVHAATWTHPWPNPRHPGLGLFFQTVV